MNRAVVFFADGLEECEGLITVDILRRAGADVTIASIKDGLEVLSSHGVTIKCDESMLGLDLTGFDLAVLPGGVKGTENLSACEEVKDACRYFAKEKMLAAICAAPSIPASLGLLEGRNATVNPMFEDKMEGAKLTHTPVAVDGNIVTGRSMAASIEFALVLAEMLCGRDARTKAEKSIVY